MTMDFYEYVRIMNMLNVIPNTFRKRTHAHIHTHAQTYICLYTYTHNLTYGRHIYT